MYPELGRDPADVGLILYSHGSVLCGAAESLHHHAQRIRSRNLFRATEAGFLNYNEPTLSDAVASLAAEGVRNVVVVPYFLVSGKFVRTDLPKSVTDIRSGYPELTFTLAQAMGYDPLITQSVLELATRPLLDWGEEESRARLGCEARADCPIRDGGCRPMEGWEPAARILPDMNALGKDDAVVVLVHGSPRESANAPAHRVVQDLSASGAFKHVGIGFLECNAPDIPSALDTAASDSPARVVAVPYFLHTGRHVALDLPRLMREARARHPRIAWDLAPYIGRSERLTDLLLRRADEALAAR